VEQADEVSVSDNAELKKLLPASPSAIALPPLRRLVANAVPYSGATLAEVLLNRRVLILSIIAPISIAAKPPALPPGVSADDLLVTRLDIDWSTRDSASYVRAAPISALITSFASLTTLHLNLPMTSVGSELFKMLCAALQSPRGPALETLSVWQADLQNGSAADFAAAVRLRQNRTLTALHNYLGGDADGAEVLRSLKSAPRLQTLLTYNAGDAPAGRRTGSALIDLLTNNDTRPPSAPTPLSLR
jgi:hypothetical protein